MSGYFYFNHDEVPHVKQVGGKAGNLATLSRNGVNVPLWVGITTSFFEEFMGGDIKKIDLLLSDTRLNQKNISKLSEKISQIILSRKIPGKLKQETEIMLNSVFGGTGNRFFSIRSSAVDEDSIHYSFAGQLESYLYVSYGSGFYGYIKKCFASAFSARVMLYRYNNKIPIKGVRPAVIIQEMIFGDVSGVVFTGNPLNNNPDQILINAAYGIGEGVVSGEIDTDMWVLDRKNSIVRYNPANKRDMITFDFKRGSGTLKRNVEEKLRDVPSIDNETVKEIAITAKRIENLFGMVHQDIEWCLKDGIVYILQSRPVTTFSHIDRSSPRTIFDNSNIIESFSGVTSPLTFSFAVTMYDAVYRQFYELMGTNSGKIEELGEVFRNMLAYINGRVYYNLNSWFITLQLLPGYNLNKEFMENMMGVKNPVDIEKRESVSTARKLFIEIPGAIKGIATVLYHLVTLDGKIQKFIGNFNKVTGPYLDDKFENRSNSELIRLYNLFIRRILKDWKAPIINDLYTMVFFGILTKMIKKLDISENANLQNDLLSGEGDIESTKPTREIIMISSWIRERKDLAELFARKSEKNLIRMILNSGDEQYSEIRKILSGYISRYGFRCMNELKLEESSLKEDPSFLFTTLKNYLKRDPIDLKELERREKEIRRKAEDLVFARIGFVKRAFFKIVLKNTRKAIKNREELRFMRTKIFGIERGTFQ